MPLYELDAYGIESFARHARILAARASIATHVAIARELLSAEVLAQELASEHGGRVLALDEQPVECICAQQWHLKCTKA